MKLHYTLVGALCLGKLAQGARETQQKRPNIVFILTDDQDVHMNSLDYMPFVHKHLIQQGALYSRHYCTVAICCPSRVNLWTGQMAHNTNVTDVSPPYGGYPKFVANGYNENHLAVWLQKSGYHTYYSGKLFNSHTTDNYNSPHVKGYTGSEFLLDPFTYQYYNSTTTRNGEPPVNHFGQYSPDLTAQSAFGFLEEALSQPEVPFFLTIAPIAPHADVTLYPEIIAGPPKVAERHRHLFKEYKIPRTENFNPETPSGVSWVAKLPRLNETIVEYNDEYQRCRLRALQSVDEMIDELFRRLDAAGELENTYVFYTSDNGYHIGQHRMHPGKECGFETDINVPLMVRGPRIAAGSTRSAPTSHTDLVPTILELAGIPLENYALDGAAIGLSGGSRSSEHVGIEFWGLGVPEGRYGYSGKYQFANGTANAYVNNTYKGIRIESDDYAFYYSVWCTNERELYDMKKDPGQLRNLLGEGIDASRSEAGFLGRSLQVVVNRLDALMMVVKSCKRHACVEPWSMLHPMGDVKSLGAAMSEKYDAFYAAQPKVSFDSCSLGFIRELEGPQSGLAFHGNSGILNNEESQRPLVDSDWSIWV